MPRQSIESKAAASFRTGSTAARREPPKHLSEGAAKVWREVVDCRPADWFAPGSLHLLESFCSLTVTARTLAAAVEAAPSDDAAIGRLTKATAALTTLATKLRLSVQSNVDRGSRMLDEVETVPKPKKLLGGKVVEFRSAPKVEVVALPVQPPPKDSFR